MRYLHPWGKNIQFQVCVLFNVNDPSFIETRLAAPMCSRLLRLEADWGGAESGLGIKEVYLSDLLTGRY